MPSTTLGRGSEVLPKFGSRSDPLATLPWIVDVLVRSSIADCAC